MNNKVKNTIYLVIVFMLCSQDLFSQNNFEKVLNEIEANSTTLAALKQQAEAQKISSRTGIYLSNPVLEFNYLWGNQSIIGDRKDINISQSLDFPTAYHYKKKISDGMVLQADLQYLVQRKSIIAQARSICIDLVYCNSLKIELERRRIHAQSIALAYQVRFEKGEANILEQNKAKLNLLTIQKEIENNQLELNSLIAELTRMNGGKFILLNDSTYQPYSLKDDFEKWYASFEANNPELRYLSQEIEISRKQVQLKRTLALPKMSIGYRSEYLLDTKFQGIGVGISIPFWENKNAVRSAKAQSLALQTKEIDTKIQFYTILKNQYIKTKNQQLMVEDYNKVLKTINSGDLLKIALEKGQLSLIEYIMELSLYYEAIDRTLSLERDLQHTIAELRKWVD